MDKTDENLNINSPIGVFDSGVGGLTVMKEIRNILPNESVIYVGDTKNVPYGNKTPEELLAFAHEIMAFFISKKVKAVVIACGTSSANVYHKLDYGGLPIIDVIRPVAEKMAAEAGAGKNIGLLATPATIKNGLFERLLAESMPHATIHPIPCPLFAPMIEAGLGPDHPGVHFAVDAYLGEYKDRLDTIVLGCTHYPYLIPALGKLGDYEFINIGQATGEKLKAALAGLGLLSDKENPTQDFYVTGPREVFKTIGAKILGHGIALKNFA